MNSLINSGIVYFIDYGNNFAYVLKDNGMFHATEYKVLQSQPEGVFLKCMKLLYNGKIQFYYMNDGCKSLAEMVSSLNADKFSTIMFNLLKSVKEVKQNGFLSCQNIDISFEHIFIDPATYSVSLVYLPVSKKIYNSVSEFESSLRLSLAKLIQNVPALSSQKTREVAAELENDRLDFDDIYTTIKGEEKENAKERIAPQRGKMKLVAVNTAVPFEMPITKDEFFIGRKREVVDGVISYNRMVGRTHCKVVRQENRYVIVDLQSSNGTYVNKVRLQPNQPCTPQDGDSISLANSEFRVVFYQEDVR